ncbi:MAG: hypothetical protein K2P14_03965 [Anaeroplasmataceae bacterium]|nr:hypothetical protein [Anaeroplasmataceae bacterium]
MLEKYLKLVNIEKDCAVEFFILYEAYTGDRMKESNSAVVYSSKMLHSINSRSNILEIMFRYRLWRAVYKCIEGDLTPSKVATILRNEFKSVFNETEIQCICGKVGVLEYTDNAVSVLLESIVKAIMDYIEACGSYCFDSNELEAELKKQLIDSGSDDSSKSRSVRGAITQLSLAYEMEV